MSERFYSPDGGHPPQHQLLTDRAVFTEAYAVLPKGTMRDITASYLPFWDATRLWVIARPMTGFAETFSHYLMDVAPGGGSDRPENDPQAQAVLFVSDGAPVIVIGGCTHQLEVGSYVYLPPGMDWQLRNTGETAARFHWIRKRYVAVDGLPAPDAFVTNARDASVVDLPQTEGRWSNARFVDPADMRHDMHVNIVTLQPGAAIPFMETHVMEHGLFVLEGKGVYRLNRDWVEVEAGDYMWLRAFCPQACYAGGPGRFRYLLYKDVNRHMPLPRLP